MTTIDRLIIQNNLKIDLFKSEFTEEQLINQVNSLINKKINQLIKQIKNDSVVIYYQTNDTVSLIGYHLLKIVQSIKPFKLFIYNKNFLIYKKEKGISFSKIKKLVNKNAIVITSYNKFFNKISYPLYKVEKINKLYKKINFTNTIDLMSNFNLKEIEIAKTFYGIEADDFKDDLNSGLINYTMCPIENVPPSVRPISKFFEPVYKVNNIYCLWLTGDLEEDNRLINLIENADDLVLYYFENEVPLILKSGFEYWLKNSTNQPVPQVNMNIYEDLSRIKICGSIYLLGNFPQDVINKICSDNNYKTNIVEVMEA